MILSVKIQICRFELNGRGMTYFWLLYAGWTGIHAGLKTHFHFIYDYRNITVLMFYADTRSFSG